MKPRDRALVFNAWMRSYEDMGMQHVSRAKYWQTYSAIVDGMLDRQPVIVYVNPEDDEQVMGFACHGGPRPPGTAPCLHYLYVKVYFRDRKTLRPGIGHKLLEHLNIGMVGAPFAHTFRTAAWDRFAATHAFQGFYVPHVPPRLKETE